MLCNEWMSSCVFYTIIKPPEHSLCSGCVYLMNLIKTLLLKTNKHLLCSLFVTKPSCSHFSVETSVPGDSEVGLWLLKQRPLTKTNEKCFLKITVGWDVRGSLIKNLIKERKGNREYCVLSVNTGGSTSDNYSELCVF